MHSTIEIKKAKTGQKFLLDREGRLISGTIERIVEFGKKKLIIWDILLEDNGVITIEKINPLGNTIYMVRILLLNKIN